VDFLAEYAVDDLGTSADTIKRPVPVIMYGLTRTRLRRLASHRSVFFQAYVQLLPEGRPKASLTKAARLTRWRLALRCLHYGLGADEMASEIDAIDGDYASQLGLGVGKCHLPSISSNNRSKHRVARRSSSSTAVSNANVGMSTCRQASLYRSARYSSMVEFGCVRCICRAERASNALASMGFD
jgi:hypothetical protein